MTAICPAGPPKLSAAIFAHTRTASPNGTPWPGDDKRSSSIALA